jgi:AraC-like DNA-binding protein
MFNARQSIHQDPAAKKFQIGDLLFAQFNCPAQYEPMGIWTETDNLLHVLNSKMAWKTSTGMCSAEPGETVFFRKGAYLAMEHFEEDACIEVYFIPDSFVRETVFELAEDLPQLSERSDPLEMAMHVKPDVALSAFLQAMTVYFAADEKPPAALLRLKLKELLTAILIGNNNPMLSYYFRSLAASDGPSIPAIMESNFSHNLSIEAFAQLCHRSLSSFKREFQKLYGTSPGKWLLERRLQHSRSLMQTTGLSITEIVFECGFGDVSHFSKTFKKKFGCPPNAYRDHSVSAPK